MKILEEIEALVSNKIEVIKTMTSIFKLETKLARLSIYPLLLNLCMLAVVFMTGWLSCMVLLGYFAMLKCHSLPLALSFILFLNVVLFVGLLTYLKFNLQNMSFVKTRKFISTRETGHHEQETTDHYPSSNIGKNPPISTN